MYSFYRKPAVAATYRMGLLGTYFDYFITWMQNHNYSQETIQNYACGIRHFQKYLLRNEIHSFHQLEGVTGQKLLSRYRQYCKRIKHQQKNYSVKLYLRSLEEAKVITRTASKNSLLLIETRRYVTFLENHRGLCEKTIRNHIYWVEKFLRFLRYKNCATFIPKFGIAKVDKFITKESVHLKRGGSSQSLISALRSFLKFSFYSEKLSADLSHLITSPRHYKLQTLPPVLNYVEIQKILNSVDRTTKKGLRDYAILILLAAYGLRASEVAHLKIEDIDWRREVIHITPRKTGKDLWLPLIPQVGKAIFNYLKQGRPPSKCRELFLLLYAPRIPVKGTTVGQIVSQYIKIAGLHISRTGAHLFRYSFASNFIRKGASLKETGDLLGHQNPESTHIYIKTAIENLRDVAMETLEVK